MSEITAEQQVSRMWQHIKGFHVVHFVSIGEKLGFFAQLREAEEGLSAAQLAAAAGLHEPYVKVWCDTGIAYEILEPAGGRYRLAPFLDVVLADPGGPRNLTPYFACTVDYLSHDLERYPEFFKSGETYTFQEHGDQFSRAIGDITTGLHIVVAKRLLPSIPGLKEVLEGGPHILDMGCGAGGLLVRLAKTYPGATCVGVDVDAPRAPAARANVAAAGLDDRIRIEHMTGETIAHQDEFDLVTLFEVIHEIPMPVRPQVIANCFQALKPGGALFILDETYPSQAADLAKPEYAFAVQTAFNELIWGNVVPTREEQESLLGEAGFVDLQRAQIGDIFTMITARKA